MSTKYAEQVAEEFSPSPFLRFVYILRRRYDFDNFFRRPLQHLRAMEIAFGKVFAFCTGYNDFSN